ncbi:ABC transporter substrate-binding protein [Komagataeibacter rhaeticus]|uniref:ABC transporter substrate-binding protein n=1 Tax=Komagataeibacter rhaeticus TaxID=215221 RepID=A0A181CCD2_9PROT|nr:ABC transporter substrate-binding protein [Komagataeibacter rhaeticus]QIP35942.1 ABC transporter substrate-binding protein [Komagataeibacter rhaeticus]QOC45703.1 ABC transporter substrate-binding protein [Komagataeibacter rhaeticus]SAY49239.1 Putative aliphatic sulfonates-binding protein precursor [Komagataeibacter rhaeticus]
MTVSLFRRVIRRSVHVLTAVLGLCAGAQAATVRVGYIPVIGSAPLFVMQGKNWTRDAGIDMQLVRFQSGPQAIQALMSGKIDAYVAGVLPLLQARAHGVDVKVVASAATEELEIVSRGALAVDLPEQPVPLAPDALRQRFADFAARAGHRPKIAAQPMGSVPDTLLRYWLKARNGLEPDQVADIVGIDIDAAQQAFLAGAVDAAILREPALTIIRHRMPGMRVLASGHDLMPGQPGSVLAILNEDAPDRAAWKNAFVSGFVRATHLLATDPEQAEPYVQQALGGGMLPKDIIVEALKASASGFVSDPARIVDAVGQLQDFELQTGLLRKAEPVGALFDLETYRQIAP